MPSTALAAPICALPDRHYLGFTVFYAMRNVQENFNILSSVRAFIGLVTFGFCVAVMVQQVELVSKFKSTVSPVAEVLYAVAHLIFAILWQLRPSLRESEVLSQPSLSEISELDPVLQALRNDAIFDNLRNFMEKEY